MEDIGNWVYVIIIGGVILSNVIKGIAKKKTVEPEPSDDWFPTEYTEPEPIVVEPILVKKPKGKSKGQTLFSEGRIGSKQMAAYIDTTAMQPIEEGKAVELNFDDADELRRGFIYSEIFGRKY